MLSAKGIWYFSSETAEMNSTKLNRKQDLNVLYQFVFFGPIRKTRWTSRPLISWKMFNFSSETNLAGSTVSTSSINFVFFGVDRKKQDGRPGLWLAETFSTFSSETTECNQWNLTEIKILTIVFFGPISKQIWPSWRIRQKGDAWYSGERYGPLGLLLKKYFRP